MDDADVDAPTDAALDPARLDAHAESDAHIAAAIAPPRPLSPLSTQRVTSQRPALRFELGRGTDGMHVELCRDRTCSTVVIDDDVSGDTYVPPDALAPGAWFFRAFGRADGTTGATASATWEIFVPRVGASIDRGWGTTRDLDGDGYDDVVVEWSEHIRVHRGGPDGPSAIASLELDGYGLYGARIVGDVNGDGRADLVVWDTVAGVSLAYGRADIAAMTRSDLFADEDDTRSCMRFASGGDLDGDGIGDLALGCGGRTSRVFVYRGSPEGVSRTRMTFSVEGGGPHYPYFGQLGGLGDIDGDGYGDLVIASGGSPTGIFVVRGRIAESSWWHYAEPELFPDTHATFDSYHRQPATAYGAIAAELLDVDGDGRAEILAAEDEGASSAVVLEVHGADLAPGDLSGVRREVATIEGALSNLEALGAVLGDVDADGTLDRAIWSGDGSEVLVERGGQWTRFDLAPTSTIRSVLAAGDIDGDGFGDLVVTHESTPATVFLGGPGGLGARRASIPLP